MRRLVLRAGAYWYTVLTSRLPSECSSELRVVYCSDIVLTKQCIRAPSRGTYALPVRLSREKSMKFRTLRRIYQCGILVGSHHEQMDVVHVYVLSSRLECSNVHHEHINTRTTWYKGMPFIVRFPFLNKCSTYFPISESVWTGHMKMGAFMVTIWKVVFLNTGRIRFASPLLS